MHLDILHKGDVLRKETFSLCLSDTVAVGSSRPKWLAHLLNRQMYSANSLGQWIPSLLRCRKHNIPIIDGRLVGGGWTVAGSEHIVANTPTHHQHSMYNTVVQPDTRN